MTQTAVPNLRAIELFAGVGGFRLGLEGFSGEVGGKQAELPGSGWSVVWGNQWEPSTKAQHAYECYVSRFDPNNAHPAQHSNEDISAVVERAKSNPTLIPDHELLVGGFPCQDYSVAKPLSQAAGIEGKKGVLWWQINDLLELKRPPFVLLENVDRLLKSPSTQRGRDFAIILSCLDRLGYFVEWRVVNAADYGFPQRRRRVFLFAQRMSADEQWLPSERLVCDGVLARALPVREQESFEADHSSLRTWFIELERDPYEVTQKFGRGLKMSPFMNAGVMQGGEVWTTNLTPDCPPWEKQVLADIVRDTDSVPASFYVRGDQVERWAYLKGPKSELRTDKKTGFEYRYSEGGMSFPDPIDRPARTILTGEGGSSPSRFKHVIHDGNRLRRLVPEELEAINGFPRGWTDTGMRDIRRAFCMGNALVVGVVQRIGCVIHDDALAHAQSVIRVA